MQSSWNQSDLSAFISASEKQGLAKDLAIRIYSTRLLGQEPELVLHGGGNTSLKTHLKDPLGDLFFCVNHTSCVLDGEQQERRQQEGVGGAEDHAGETRGQVNHAGNKRTDYEAACR